MFGRLSILTPCPKYRDHYKSLGNWIAEIKLLVFSEAFVIHMGVYSAGATPVIDMAPFTCSNWGISKTSTYSISIKRSNG
jgi:hypothetical protein